MINNEILEVGGSRWKVRYAKSPTAAYNEIAHARVTGSIGGSTTINGIVISDVIRINSDDSEAQPYQKEY